MRVITFLFIVTFFSFSMETLAGEKKSDFSGQWTLNREKSEPQEGGQSMAAQRLTVTQEGNNLSIERLAVGRSGEESKTTEKLTLDGKEYENVMLENPRKTSANWSEDSKSLTITTLISFWSGGNENIATIVEFWELSEDGKSLSIESSSESPWGERKDTYIYDKENIAE